MDKVSIIGLDLAKRAFQARGARADGGVAFRKKLWREKVLSFMAEQASCVVAMEACGNAHHWARHWRSRARGTSDSTGLRQAVCQAPKERRGRRGGDLRGGKTHLALRRNQ